MWDYNTHFRVEGAISQSYGFHSRQKGSTKRKVRRRETETLGEVVMWNMRRQIAMSQICKLIFWDLKLPEIWPHVYQKTSQSDRATLVMVII